MFERLREIRTRRGISAQTMTDLLGLETEGAYYKKENGTIKFSLFEAKAIADYLDMTIESIFFANEVSEMDTTRHLG